MGPATATDADCGPGQVCMCGEDPVVVGWAVHTCVPADCRSDADCTEGQLCVVPRAGTVCESYAPRLYDPPTCTTVHDGCRSDDWCDCQQAGEVCVFASQHLYCTEVQEIGCW